MNAETGNETATTTSPKPMPDLTKEPVYYSEFETPPPLVRMFPSAMGYISTDGQMVYYGKRPDAHAP